MNVCASGGRDEEVVGYESVDEHVRVGAGEVGDNDGRGVKQKPSRSWPTQKYVWVIATGLSRVYDEGPSRTGCSTASRRSDMTMMTMDSRPPHIDGGNVGHFKG